MYSKDKIRLQKNERWADQQRANMTTDPKFVELTAGVFRIASTM